MLKQRVVTAVILGSLIVTSVFYLPPIAFEFLALAIVLLAAWEFSSLFNLWSFRQRIIFFGLLLIVSLFMRLVMVIPMLVIGGLWWLVAPYFLWCYVKDGRNYFSTSIHYQILLGILMFSPCWLGLGVIYTSFGREFLYYLCAIVWSTDIGAYFVGRFFGKQLLLPEISPKKTVEGLYGGILTSMLVAIGGIFLLKFKVIGMNNFSMISLFMLSLTVSLWSVIGDLFESMLKRFAGVKDTGVLLPGHGGMYDRIDSLVAAVPIFALGLFFI